MAHVYRLEREQLLARPLSEVFEFFADAHNLERITPPLLRFSVLTEGEIEMKPGALIDYRLHLFGLPLRWRTRIDAYEPGSRFVDRQLEGPYSLWRHEHLFEEQDEGTLMIDRVDYSLPLDPVGRMAHPFLIRPTLERIFDYRYETLEKMFGG